MGSPYLGIGVERKNLLFSVFRGLPSVESPKVWAPNSMPGPSFAPHYGSFGPPKVPFTNEVEKVTNVKGKKKVWC